MNNSLQSLHPFIEIIHVFLVCVCTLYGMVVYIPYVMYRLRINNFTESGKTRLLQAEQEKLTGFEKCSLII